MQTFTIKRGLVVSRDERMWVLDRRTIDNRLRFTDENGEVWTIPEVEFYRYYDTRDIVIRPEQPHLGTLPLVTNAPRDLTTFAATQVNEALRRQKYLNGLLDADGNLPPKGKLLKRILEIAKDILDKKKPPSQTT